MRNTLETRLGIFFALAFVTAVIVLEMMGGLDFLKRGTILKAHFRSVIDLKQGEPVKLAGKKIGWVKDIQFADDRVLVIMHISDRTAVIRTDCKATIKFSGMLGQNYVSVDFGSAKGRPVESGMVLESVDQPDLSALMSKLEGVASGVKRLTDSLGDANFNEILLPFTDFLKENRPRIAGILTNAQAVSEQIASGKGGLGRLVYEDALYQAAYTTVTNLDSAAQEIKGAVEQAKAVVSDVNAGHGTVGRLVKDEKLYQDTAAAIESLKAILEKINQGQGMAGKLVNDDGLYRNAKLTLQKFDKAADGLEDQGPLSVVGILFNAIY